MNLTIFQYAKSNPQVGLKLDNYGSILHYFRLEIKQDIGQKSWFFHTPLYSKPPLGGGGRRNIAVLELSFWAITTVVKLPWKFLTLIRWQWPNGQYSMTLTMPEPKIGLSRTRRNDGMADGTAISKYIGRDSRQSFDDYPIITQNPTEHHWQ